MTNAYMGLSVHTHTAFEVKHIGFGKAIGLFNNKLANPQIQYAFILYSDNRINFVINGISDKIYSIEDARKAIKNRMEYISSFI